MPPSCLTIRQLDQVIEWSRHAQVELQFSAVGSLESFF